MNIFHFSSNHLISVRSKFFELLKNDYTFNELSFIFNRIIEHLGYAIYDPNIRFNQSELILISKYIKDLMDKKPLAYILGYTYFYHLKFFVNEKVLIPRPETEELTEIAIGEIHKMKNVSHPFYLLDIGTGSGCIAISIKKYIPDIYVDAIDISKQALEMAMKNAAFHNTNIYFLNKNILADDPDKTYHIIISNPPYIPIKEYETIDFSVKRYEPHTALFSKTSTEFYERIISLCHQYLITKGLLLLELHQFYAETILNIAQQSGLFSSCQLLNDMSGNKRFLIAKKY